MNPVELSQTIEHRYREYLKTTFYFKDKEFRDSFQEALASGHLSKGPYLEATPVFKRGATPASLFPVLAESQIDQSFLSAIHGHRPLYQHQDTAIRKVSNGKNVLVATGTGSGKTEAFLYPILLHLYREFQAGALGPGVRALILYPMNALANDQRERLGEIGKALEDTKSPFHFTFGQYIGETPEDERDSKRHAQDFIRNRMPGELVLRSEMRKTPPHILLTNYSMLEFLLLRPDDSDLFDNGRAHWWAFFVLDEAHQYRGSRGIEMGLLLRRLRQRLREGGRTGPFCCIATSATLAQGLDDRALAAHFASDLFGDEFLEEDVVFGETEPLGQPGPHSLDVADYRALNELLASPSPDRSTEAIATFAQKLGTTLPHSVDLAKVVGALLKNDRRSADLKRLIARDPVKVHALANDLFSLLPEAERLVALTELVELLLAAEEPDSGVPLLSARYHFFLRSLEGAFLQYLPSKCVFLERGVHDPESRSFEVALCRECGQHYFVGRILPGGKLGEAVRDPSVNDFGATFFRPLENESVEHDPRRVRYMCLRCGMIKPREVTCGHGASIRVVEEESPTDDDRADQIARCGACGYHAAGRDPVRELVHGSDGPNAVIATTLHKHLPQGRKKILAFADGRQEAAFFAWYLEDSFHDIRRRNFLMEITRDLSAMSSEGLSLRDLVPQLRDAFRARGVFPPAAGELELRRNAWLWLYQEFVTEEERICLEGVGLTRWTLKLPPWIAAPSVFLQPPWSLTRTEANDLLALLLNTMRSDKALELQTEKGVSLNWSDLDTAASQLRVRIGDPGNQKGVRSWDGKGGKRASFLQKLLLNLQPHLTLEEALSEAVNALRKVWEQLRTCDETAARPEHRLLLPFQDARRLNPDWWRLSPVPDSALLYQCTVCARLQPVSIRGVCARHRCPGILKGVTRPQLPSNHYRVLYEEDLPASLRVEEHTAQLDNEKAREFQREFRDDKIDVLSCSTTFELGVDLGNLDTIFLRDVPPEPFNYAQRVGRAGRRRRPGFAITYCRRGPHDLYHFSDPLRILRGTARPPLIKLENEKIILRHVAAVALSSFLRSCPRRFEGVQALFVDLLHPSAVKDIDAFLRLNRAPLEQSLLQIVPEHMVDRVGVRDGTWISRVVGSDSRFSLAQAEVAGDFCTVKLLEEKAAREGDYDTARWAKDRAKTVASEDVLSFLSRKAVIPKYGFPVDVVELDPQRTSTTAQEVSLQRDLSIAVSEFAPTSKLIANKKLWSSYGLKRVPEREWQRKRYKRCSEHNVFAEWKEGESEPESPCDHTIIRKKYVVPSFGFVMNREGPAHPTGRPPRVFTTRPYFARSLGPDPGSILIPEQAPVISLRRASPGLMAILCEGRRGEGFYVCGDCGAAFRNAGKPTRKSKGHLTPQGQPCNGTLDQVSLGHEFETDILQMQFLRPPDVVADRIWFAHSLGYAIVEGAADILDVPSGDLSAVVGHADNLALPPIILYDAVPGGAGLVSRLQDAGPLKECLQAARTRVAGNCGCGDDTSCYGCLRNYRNQFAHQYLKRGEVLNYLTQLPL